MSTDTRFETGIVVKPVLPGAQAILKRSDGTAISAWGPSRKKAVDNLNEIIMRGSNG